MLSNAYFLAKFRFDTAENEPAKKLQNLPILLTLTLYVCGPRPAGAFHYFRSSGRHAVREQLQHRFCASEQFIRLCFTSCGVALLSRALAPYPPPGVSR